MTPQEEEDCQVKRCMTTFNTAITEKLGDPMKDKDLPELESGHHALISVVTPVYEAYEDDNEKQSHAQNPDDFDPETYDAYVWAQIELPCEDDMKLGTVLHCKCDKDGRPTGKYNQSPLLDTCIYEVEFSDGEILEYAANIITENLYSQCGNEGHQQIMPDELVDHRSDDSAVKMADGTITLNGCQHPCITPKGWQLLLCVLWKDGFMSWESLADLKEAYPIQTAEYAVS